MNKKISILSISVILLTVIALLLNSCKKDEVEELTIVDIGDFHKGGVVFYILQSSDVGYNADVQHGFVCAVSDQTDDNGVEWSENVNVVVGGLGAVSDTDGKANTAAIVLDNITVNKAATLCIVYRGGEFDDWFLPAKTQLASMHSEIDKINATSRNNGGSDFDISGASPTYSVYWSSTEYNNANALLYPFYPGFASTYKGMTYRVRAVRAF